MEDFFKGLSADFILYTISVLVQIISIPIYLNFISDYELGIWIVIQSVMGFLGLFSALGGNPFLIKKISSDTLYSDQARANIYFSNIMLMQAFAGISILLFGGILWANIDLIIPADVSNESISSTFTIVLIVLIFNLPIDAYNSILKARKRLALSNVIENSRLIVLSIAAVFFMYLDFGFLSFGFAAILSNLMPAFYVIFIIKRDFPGVRVSRSDFSLELVREVYNYMKHIIPLVLINSLRSAYLPFIVAKLFNPGLVLIVNLTYKLPQTIQGIFAKIAINLFPLLCRSYEDNSSVREQYITYSVFLMRASALLIILLMYLNGPFVKTWVGDSRLAGSYENAVLILSAFVYMYANGIGIFIDASGRFGKLVKISFFELFLAFILSIVLYEPYGLLGVLSGYMSSRFISLFYVIRRLNIENNTNFLRILSDGFYYIFSGALLTLLVMIMINSSFEINTWIEIILVVAVGIICNILPYELIRFFKCQKQNFFDRLKYSLRIDI